MLLGSRFPGLVFKSLRKHRCTYRNSGTGSSARADKRADPGAGPERTLRCKFSTAALLPLVLLFDDGIKVFLEKRKVRFFGLCERGIMLN